MKALIKTHTSLYSENVIAVYYFELEENNYDNANLSLPLSVEGLLLVSETDDDNYFIKMSRYTAENFVREIYSKDKIDLSDYTAYFIDDDNVLHEDY